MNQGEGLIWASIRKAFQLSRSRLKEATRKPSNPRRKQQTKSSPLVDLLSLIILRVGDIVFKLEVIYLEWG